MELRGTGSLLWTRSSANDEIKERQTCAEGGGPPAMLGMLECGQFCSVFA